MAQAKAALAQYKDVMQAAERFFEGAFDHVKDEDGDVPMASVSKPAVAKPAIRMAVSTVARNIGCTPISFIRRPRTTTIRLRATGRATRTTRKMVGYDPRRLGMSGAYSVFRGR